MRSKWRKALRATDEFIDQFGLPHLIRMAMRYEKGFKGLSYRTGRVDDDFVRNQMTVVVYLMKVPRIIAPKQRRKNTISNRKQNRISK